MATKKKSTAKKKTTPSRKKKAQSNRKASKGKRDDSNKAQASKTQAGKAQAKTAVGLLQQRLEKILAKPNSVDACSKFFAKLNEKQRRSLSKFCLDLFEKTPSYVPHKKDRYRENPRMPGVGAAVFATASLTDLKQIVRGWKLPPSDVMVQTLKQRKPAWIDSFVDDLLSNDRQWKTVRGLVREKVCRRPDDERYYTGMIIGLVGRWERNQDTVLSRLKDDPALLKHEVWKLFEYEGEGDNTLANVDRFERVDWSGSLVKLSRDGKLSRKRLLDSAISALGLGFNHYRSRWFFNFFDQLEPNEKELAQRSDDLLHLISSPIPNVAKWAFEKSNSLIKSGRIKDPQKVIASVEPLLTAKPKSTVVNTIKLLADLAHRSPKCQQDVAEAVVVALCHEKAEVQKKAFKLVSELGDRSAELVAQVAKYVPVAAPSFRKRLQTWVDESETNESMASQSSRSETSSSTKKFSRSQLKGYDKRHIQLLCLDQLMDLQGRANPRIPAAIFDGTDIRRLDPANAVTPIQDIEELIEVASRVIEDATLVDEAEQVLDGLARLCDQIPDNFETLTGPILKRSIQLMKRSGGPAPFNGFGAAQDIQGLMYSWIKNVVVRRKAQKTKNGTRVTYVALEPIVKDSRYSFRDSSFLSIRGEELCKSVGKRQARSWLSAPTHRGGWIDPRVFVSRLNKLTSAPTEIDLILALLRLAPDHKSKALKKLKTKLKGEWLNAVKYALGGARVRIGSSAPLWVAAARSRSPMQDDEAVAKAFPKLGPGGGKVGSFRAVHKKRSYRDGGKTYFLDCLTFASTPAAPNKSNPLIPTQWANRSYNLNSSLCKWNLLTWPANVESFFVPYDSELFLDIDYWEQRWEPQCLLSQDTPIGPAAMFSLVSGLAAKTPEAYGLATDIVIKAIREGRVGSDNFSESLKLAFGIPGFKLPRWAKRFGDIAQASELHGYLVFRALEGCLPSLGEKLPPGLGDILEVMVEIGADLELGITDPNCEKFLASQKGSTKTAKKAKQLLSLSGNNSGGTAVREAIAGRIQLLSAWKART